MKVTNAKEMEEQYLSEKKKAIQFANWLMEKYRDIRPYDCSNRDILYTLNKDTNKLYSMGDFFDLFCKEIYKDCVNK